MVDYQESVCYKRGFFDSISLSFFRYLGQCQIISAVIRADIRSAWCRSGTICHPR
jgi:hypothetical protein